MQEVLDPSQTKGWASNIVIQHTSPTGGKFTTVSWHVNPATGISRGTFVPKGMQIGTVADLTPYGHGTHFHFGIRIGAYVARVSGLGALPYATHPCDGYPVFPAGFVDPEDPNYVLFQ